MSYYFEIRIILPEEERNKFLNRKLNKQELSEVTHYLQKKTSRGIPVKFRVGIFNEADNMKIMSVTLNTKNTKETDVINLLLNRVTDRDVLVFLNQQTESTLPPQDVTRQEVVSEIANNQSIPEEVDKEKKESKVMTSSSTINHSKNENKKNNNNQLAPKKKIGKFNLLLLPILTFFIVLLTGISVIQQIQLQSVKKEIKEQIERVKETDISQSKIDTFGRYFLTYYFSQEEDQEKYQSSLKNYVSDKTNIVDWKSLEKTLKSVNYYGSEQIKNGYSVTYILVVEEDERSKMQQITFDVEPTKNGFLVTNQPTLTDFSFN